MDGYSSSILHPAACSDLTPINLREEVYVYYLPPATVTAKGKPSFSSKSKYQETKDESKSEATQEKPFHSCCMWRSPFLVNTLLLPLLLLLLGAQAADISLD